MGSVRNFGTFTQDLEAMAEWLSSCGVREVAMESTGVYWVPVFEVLDRAGFEGALGEPAGDQAGERAQERRAGLPVDPATDELWTVAGARSGRRTRCARCARTCASAANSSPKGTQRNNERLEDKDEGPISLVIRAAWIKAARRRGLCVDEWIVRSLNKEAKS